MLLNQVVLQQQRISLSAGNGDFDIGYFGNQRHRFLRQPRRAEVARHPTFQVFCLTNVKEPAVSIIHLVDPSARGQLC